MGAGFAIHQIFQFLARLEERDLLSGNIHAVAGFGIPSNAGLALASAKAAKTADLNFVASPQ